jgi:exonuclease SbcD
MKLLHTSDWHLGQTLHQHEREAEHARFLAWLLDTLQAEQIDALLVAGDVFDNTNPSAASQAMLYRFLAQARQRVPHLNIVITAGNHDSPGRLQAPSPLLAEFGAHVVGTVGNSGDASPDLARLVVPLRNRAGDVAAWCMAVPFLRPADVPRVEVADDAYAAGTHALYARVYAHAASLRQPGQAVLAMGHCHLTGGQVSEDSERRIVVGGAEALSASLFDTGIAYVALGHLHLAQTVGGDATRRYCGSPLPMSFSEIHYPHQVVVVELAGEAVASVRSVPVPRTVDLLRVPPRPAPLPEVLAALGVLPDVAPDAQPDDLWPYLQVRVQLTQPEPGLRAQIEAALAGKAVRLVRIETSLAASAAAQAAPPVSLDELGALSPTAFFERLYRHRFNDTPPSPELLGAFAELLVEAGDAEAGANQGAKP